MSEVYYSLVQLVVAAFDVVKALFFFVLPYVPLISWIGFWLLGVNWVKLYEVLFRKGGVVGLLLIAFCWILIWGLIAPPADGSHNLLGLKLGNFVGKTVFVTSLVTIMFLCGSVQLSGLVAGWTNFVEPEETDAHGHAGHGHDAHGGHDHGHGGDHGHSHDGHGH